MTIPVFLFDLDGTLTDPKPGITASIRFALEQLRVHCPDDDVLATYIGPPLRRSFAMWLDTTEPELIEEAMHLYRVRFGDTGLLENRVYEGIPAMLERVTQAGYRAYVATSKPTVYARRIVEHFQLDGYFQQVYGAELDGRFENKAELLTHLLAAEQIAPGEAVMIGDRSADIVAAKANGLASVGVLWGYGSADELREAGAGQLCAAPAELAELLLSGWQ